MGLVYFLIFYILAIAVGVYAHEGGHLVCGSLVGLHARRVTLGTGPTVLRGRVVETEIVINLIPFGGRVEIFPALSPKTSASLLFLAGGALTNILLLSIFIACFSWTRDSDWTQSAAWGVVSAQIALIVVTLVPFSTATIANDALQMLQLLSNRNKNLLPGSVYASMLHVYGWPETAAPASKASTRIFYRVQQKETLPDRLATASALLRELSRDGLSQAETLLIRDTLVTRQLLYRDLGLHERLDELSSQALAIAPNLATLRGSRGAALVEIGRYDEGAALLAPLADGSPSFDTILSQLFLARGLKGLGRLDEARSQLESARAILEGYAPKEAVALFARTETEIAN